MLVGLQTYRSADWVNPYTSSYTNYNVATLKENLYDDHLTGVDLLTKQMHAPEWETFVSVDVPA